MSPVSAGVPRGAAPGGPPAGRGGTLTVLGCDGSYPGPGGAASGYLVSGGGVSVWLDAGPGTFAALQLATDPGRLDAVVLSHEHPDHWTDVESLAVWLREHGRTGEHGCTRAPMPVYAPPGLRARSYFADDQVFDWHEVEPPSCVLLAARRDAAAGGGLRASFSATDHGPPTLAARFEAVAPDVSPGPLPPPRGGAANVVGGLAYSADTGPGWSPEELGPGIGTFLCEATYTRELEGSARHLSARQAGALGAAAGVGRLVLTHRRPTVPEARLRAEGEAAFGGPVVLAQPGARVAW